ncbi:MAG: RlmE family RNA methyltransferase [Alphaproteobacteria bacterium]
MRFEKSIRKFNKHHSEITKRWLKRQDRDPFVHQARAEGFRSRAVYKLQEIQQKYGLLRSGTVVLDLGAAPGSWTQWCVHQGCHVVAVDRLPMDPLTGATVVCADLQDDDAQAVIHTALAGRTPQVILSDMAPNTTGHRATDHLQVMALCDLVLSWALIMLPVGGCMVMKSFDGAETQAFLTACRGHFDRVSRYKPEASRKESSEFYIIAQGFRGTPPKDNAS